MSRSMEKTPDSCPRALNCPGLKDNSGTFIATQATSKPAVAIRLFYSEWMKINTLIILLLLACVCHAQSSADRVLVSVKRNYVIPKTETALIVLDFNELKRLLPRLHEKNL